MSERELRVAVFGTGFWARFQLPAWRELAGAEVVALYNRTRSKAEALAAEHGIPAVYDDPARLLAEQDPDVVDVIAGEAVHRELCELALAHGAAVICQKPLAPTLADAEGIVAAARAAGRPLLVHENFRWQAPLRRVKQLLDEGRVGRPFRGRIQFSNSFPVFENQPFLRDAERFILLDLGSHHLDVARFLFGEVSALWCRTARINPGIRGEDVATVALAHEGCTSTVELSYASRLADEAFPETFVLVEADAGSIELGPGHAIRVTTAAGTETEHAAPPLYSWADPAYALVHASIVACQANLLAALRGEGAAETTGEDNLRTARLVFGAYESARTGQVIAP